MLLSPDIVQCFDRSFAWDKNTEPDIAGYRIYYKIGASGAPYDGTGADEGDSPIKIPIASLNDPENPEYTIHGLSGTGAFYFVATAYDIYDNESGYSNELSYQLSSPQPPAPNTNTSIVVDNGDPETSSVGSWLLSGGENYYGTQSKYSRTVNGKYTYEAALNGSYDIALWWTTWPSRCTAVPVEIYDGTTRLDTVTVNHQVNGGQWNPIGSGPYTFSGQAKVSIVSTAVGSCTTCADAVRFERSETTDNTPPVSEITAPATGSSFNASNSINFTGTAIDFEDGNISESLSWTSNLDGVIGNGAMFSTSALSEGTHTITASATDSGGLPCSATITVTVLFSSNTDEVDETTETVKDPGDVLNEDNTEMTSIVIDNGDPGTFFTGTWRVSGGSDPFNPDDPSATSLWSRNGDTYTWTFTPTNSGYHDFSMWWTEWHSRSNNVPVTISYYGGTETLYINQRRDGGRWNLLETYPFEAGVDYGITITAVPGGTQNYSTCADAVQFIYQPGLNVLPVATIDSISPNPAITDALITFTGHGDDLDGTISGFSWDSSIDGHLGDSPTFTTSSPLSPGIHTISFTVVDDDSAESEPVTRTLIVQDTITEVIINNGDPETSFTGTWRVSGGTAPWDPADPSATSLWSRNGDTYTWAFIPTISGVYEISMWWTRYPTRSTNIPVTIEFDGGTDIVTINQQINGAKWNSLESYPFAAGVKYDITIASQPWPSSTCADAVRFVSSPNHQ